MGTTGLKGDFRVWSFNYVAEVWPTGTAFRRGGHLEDRAAIYVRIYKRINMRRTFVTYTIRRILTNKQIIRRN